MNLSKMLLKIKCKFDHSVKSIALKYVKKEILPLLKSTQTFPLQNSNLLASMIGGEVKTGSYRGYVFWDFITGRFYQSKEA